MHPARTTPQARNHAVRQRRDGRGGKWRTFAASGAHRGAPRVPRRRTGGSTTTRCRSVHGHNAPPPQRRVVTNRRPRGLQPTVPAPSATRTRHVATTRARRRRSTPAWRPAPPLPRCSPGRTVGRTTPGCRSAHGHDVPSPHRRVVTNRRPRGPQPTVPAPSATGTRRVVTTRARRRRSTPAWRPAPPPPRCARRPTGGPTTLGRRSALGHDVPPPQRLVVTNRRPHGSQPTDPAPSATRTRHVVTTRARR
jgi:hypothetical protein